MMLYTDNQVKHIFEKMKALDVLARSLPEAPYREHVEKALKDMKDELLAYEQVSVDPVRLK